MPTQSRHVATLTGSKPVFESDGGSIQQLTADDFGILKRLSIKRIVLEPGAIREPQWNVNANQLAIVVSGRVLVSTLGNADSFSSFVVEAGQMYHVESGAIYHIENVGDETAVVVAALRTGHPAHFSLQDSFSAMTDAVLGNAYDLMSHGDPSESLRAEYRALARSSGVADYLIDRFTISGTPEECAGRVLASAEAGAERHDCANDSPIGGLGDRPRAWAAEVMPLLDRTTNLTRIERTAHV